MNYYRALFKMNIPCDLVAVTDDLSAYELVIAPILYMIKDGYDKTLRDYVGRGGHLITTYFSGYVDDSDLVYGAYPGKLRDILGIWVEESDALPENESNRFFYHENAHPARILCDLVHPEGAEVLAEYEEDFYAGTPLLTVNEYGDGKAYYVGTSSDETFYSDFLQTVCTECRIEGVFAPQEQVEVTRRVNEKGSYLFILNHNAEAVSLTMETDGIDVLRQLHYQKGQVITLSGKDVIIYKEYR